MFYVSRIKLSPKKIEKKLHIQWCFIYDDFIKRNRTYVDKNVIKSWF